jgi:hypothetical protein
MNSKAITIEGVLHALESETAKLDSLQSLCAVVAEGPDIMSGHAMTGAVFAIMNSVEAIKDKLGEVVSQLMIVQREVASNEAAELPRATPQRN